MALWSSRWLSLGPRIRKVRGKLIATTSWRGWLLTLGLCNRRVVVDPDQEKTIIRDRYFWFFPSCKTIRFGQVRAIAYGYGDANQWGGLNYARDTLDVYRVGLLLHGDYDNFQHLFSFIGEGSFVNEGPWPDRFYWEEYLIDVEGSQAAESKLFVELLMKMLKVRLEPI